MEFKLDKSRETSHFNPLIQIKGDWMLGFTSLEVYNSIFNINTKINKFKLRKYPDEKAGGVSYEKVREEIEKDLDISDFTATDIQDGIISPFITKEYREQVVNRMKDDKFMLILSG